MTSPSALPPLLTPAEAATRRGGPFDREELASAGEAVRGACGWHVAPVVTDHTVLVSGPPGPRLLLPTGVGQGPCTVDVTEVRDVVADRPVTGWRPGVAGMLIRSAGWPRGEDNLLVTLTHGYPSCPSDLAAVVVERARALADPVPTGVRSEARTSGGVSRNRTYSESTGAWSLAAVAVLDRYRVA